MAEPRRLSSRDPDFEAELERAARLRGRAGRGRRARRRRDPRGRARGAATRRCSSTRARFDRWSPASRRGARSVAVGLAREALARIGRARARGARDRGGAHPRAITSTSAWSAGASTEDDGTMLGQQVTPLDRVGPLRARRQGRLSVLGADERGGREGRRRAPSWSWWCPRPTACATTTCWPRRRSPAWTASSAWAAPRRSARSPSAPRTRPGRRQDRRARATPTSPRRSAACSGASASTWSPARRRSW